MLNCSEGELRLLLRDLVAEIADRDRFIGKREAAQYLSMSVSNVEKRLAEIPHYRIGCKVLFRKRELDAWMMKHREQVADLDLDRIADEAAAAVLGPRRIGKLEVAGCKRHECKR